MAELLPDRLGSYWSLTPEDKGGVPKSKRRAVTNILEWIQCFSIYIAIIALKHPDKVPDLLGYQSLIIDASIQYEGDSWIGYDCRFRLSAAANSTKIWASLDPTLWNLAFAGNARVQVKTLLLFDTPLHRMRMGIRSSTADQHPSPTPHGSNKAVQKNLLQVE